MDTISTSNTFENNYFIKLIAIVLFGLTANSSFAETQQPIMISAQPLYSAITAFAEQTGIQFVYDAAPVEGLKFPRVDHEPTSQKALNQMLANSDLSYEFTDNHTAILTH